MKILIVDNNNGSGDWKGLYINGKLVLEGHSLVLVDALLEIMLHREPIREVFRASFTDEQMEEMGYSFPKNAEELPEHRKSI